MLGDAARLSRVVARTTRPEHEQKKVRVSAFRANTNFRDFELTNQLDVKRPKRPFLGDQSRGQCGRARATCNDDTTRVQGGRWYMCRQCHSFVAAKPFCDFVVLDRPERPEYLTRFADSSTKNEAQPSQKAPLIVV